MTQNVGRLGVVLALNTAEFVKGLGDATIALSKFVEKAKPAITGAGAAMAAMTAKAIAFADEMTDLSKANDMAISTFLELGTALQLSGGKADNAGKMVAFFTSKIDDAAQGSAEAQYAFSRLGISLNDLSKLSNEELMRKTLDALAKIPDAATRNGLAMQFFSKAVRGVDLKGLNEELENMKGKYKEQEEGLLALGEVADAMYKMYKMSIVNVAQAVGEDLKTTLEYIEKINKSTDTMGAVFRTVFETIAVVASDIYFVVERIFALFQQRFAIGFFASADEVRAMMDRYNKESEELRKELDAYQAKILDNTKKEKKETGATDSTGRPVETANATALAAAKAISAEYKLQALMEYEKLKRKGDYLVLSTREKEVVEAVSKIEDERVKKLFEIDKKIEEARTKKNQGEVIKQLEKEKEAINDITDAVIALTQAEILEQQALQRTFEYGWFKAFQKYTEDAGNYAKMAGDIFDSVTRNMESAIDRFVETGKLSFGDFARSVIQDLIKIQLRMQMMSMFKGLGNIFGVSMGNVLQAQTGITVDDNGVSLMVGGSYADGGSPPVGVPSLVGENGPELFIPQTSGTIIPNGQLGDSLGGQTINYNGPYIANMSAIDTQSATQFLARNKQAVWSANQSASRGLPTSR